MREEDVMLDQISQSLTALHANGQEIAESHDGVDSLLEGVHTAQDGMKRNERTARRS